MATSSPRGTCLTTTEDEFEPLYRENISFLFVGANGDETLGRLAFQGPYYSSLRMMLATSIKQRVIEKRKQRLGR